jgi:hypothetical protein
LTNAAQRVDRRRRGGRDTEVQHFRMRRRHSEQYLRGTLRSSPMLLPVLERIHTDAEQRSELGQTQLEPRPKSGDARRASPSTSAALVPSRPSPWWLRPNSQLGVGTRALPVKASSVGAAPDDRDASMVTSFGGRRLPQVRQEPPPIRMVRQVGGGGGSLTVHRTWCSSKSRAPKMVGHNSAARYESMRCLPKVSATGTVRRTALT